MKRIGYFDSTGKCLVIYSGAGEPPNDLEYAYSAEVPSDLGPNTVEHTGKGIRRKERVFERPERPARKTQAAEIAELKAEIAELKKKLK